MMPVSMVPIMRYIVCPWEISNCQKDIESGGFSIAIAKTAHLQDAFDQQLMAFSNLFLA